MTITPEKIIAVAPAAKPYADELVKQMLKKRIDTPLRASRFLGQVHVESMGFRRVVENLDYSEQALLKLFSRSRISAADAARYGRNKDHPADQRALADILYGGEFGRRELGNTQPGDGWRFRGRGLKQLTGRYNYEKFSLAWLGDETLLDSPELVERPAGAVASAVWFWVSHGLNQLADTGTVTSITRVVNGGTNGLADRVKWTEAYSKALT